MYKIANAVRNALIDKIEANGSVFQGHLKNSVKVTFKGTTLYISVIGYGKDIEFGCFFDKNTKIKTKNGFKKIKDLLIGEELWTGKQYKKIIQKEKLEIGYPIKKVIIKTKTRELAVTEDHPIYTKNGWKTAKEIKVGDRLYIIP